MLNETLFNLAIFNLAMAFLNEILYRFFHNKINLWCVYCSLGTSIICLIYLFILG